MMQNEREKGREGLQLDLWGTFMQGGKVFELYRKGVKGYTWYE